MTATTYGQLFDDYLSEIEAKEFTFSYTVDRDKTLERSIVELFSDNEKVMPFYVRTGPIMCGNPLERKTFKSVELHTQVGQPGTLRVRIYIDGRYVCDSRVTASDAPGRHNRVNIPIGRRTGYGIDLEFSGNTPFTGIEVNYDPYEGDTDG